MAKQVKTYTLFNNYDCYDFDEMKAEMCECNDLNPDEVSDRAVWDYINMCASDDYDIAKDALCRYTKGHKILAVGSIGLWNGTFDGGKVYDDTDKMLNDVLTDCVYCKIEYTTDGHLYVQGTHHDGTIAVEVKLLNDNGADAYSDWDYSCKYGNKTEQEIHAMLWSNFYSRLPHLEKVA